MEVEELAMDNLRNSDKKLELLDEKSMAEALNDFVKKEERKALENATERLLPTSARVGHPLLGLPGTLGTAVAFGKTFHAPPP